MQRVFFLMALLVGLVPSSLWGQATSTLLGVVTDPTGAVVPGATVTLENPATGFTRVVATNQQGAYNFANVPPGTYRVRARFEGFVQIEVNEVVLQVAQSATLPLRFEEVGSVTEVVSVSAEATPINTTDASIGNAIGTRPILQLPFQARNVVGMLSLQPGVTFIGDSQDLTEDRRSGSVNGGKSDQANVTLDGVDVNDQQNRYAFTSVLRMTLDSVQEFRVTTLNANASEGRSSGAQITLVTKSGSNQFHGSLYEFHRNTVTSANDFFNNTSGVKRPKLIRNIFGGSIGGPIKQDRAFFFFNYEGRRDASETSEVRNVPSTDLRNGIVKYRTTGGGIATLSPTDIRTRVDPAGLGPNQRVLDLFRSYPEPNDATVGDGLNIVGYRFVAPLSLKQNTYITRLDMRIDRNGNHNLFLRGNLQNDRDNEAPQFPGEPPARVRLNNSKGLGIGYDAILSPTLVSNFRYGFTRQGDEQTGQQTQSAISFRNIANRFALTRGITRILPVHTIREDVNWRSGSHNIQFGGIARYIANQRTDLQNSFNRGNTNSSWLQGSGNDLQPADLNRTFRVAYNDAMVALLGIVSFGEAIYNYTPGGQVIPTGDPIFRNFKNSEFESYIQDTWQVTRGLTLTYGLRWSLMRPVYEANGAQVSTIPSLAQFFATRGALAAAGRSQAEVGKVQVDLAGRTGRPLYPYHKDNLAPRLAIAYSPQSTDGLLAKLFGGPGNTVIRAGAGMFYDAFGQGIMRRVNASSLGLSTTLSNFAGSYNSATAPRFTGLFDLPGQLLRPPPPGGFPQTVPELFAITNSLDDSLEAPYSMTLNFSIGRQLGWGLFVEGSYVGRLSRRSLIQADLAMPTNLRDPKSGQTYFEAASALARLSQAKTPIANVAPIAFWENMWPGAAGNGRTATQAMYDLYSSVAPDYTFGLFFADTQCDPSCSVLGRNAIFNSQYSALSAWRSIANGNYHAMQWTVRKSFSSGVQFDVNYTFGKSIDLASYAENAGNFDGFVVNSWEPGQRRAVSDYDMRHQFNTNWVAELPFGRNKKWLSGVNGVADAFLGGWQISGLYRHTSGLPVGVGNGRNWPTNWNITGFATPVKPHPVTSTTKNAPAVAGAPGPNLFPNPTEALTAYDFTLPGQSGERNGLRGDGFFTIDMGLGKRFRMPFEGHSLQFRWEVFNVTNSVRFDVNDITLDLGNTGSFGKYSTTLTNPRVMQFALRYEW